MVLNKKVKKYAEQVDPILKRAIYSLDSETRFAIVAALSEKGELTFSQLKDELALDQSTLTDHLRRLTQGGLVESYYQKKPDTDEYSFYGVTEFGKDFMAKLSELVDPEKIKK